MLEDGWLMTFPMVIAGTLSPTSKVPCEWPGRKLNTAVTTITMANNKRKHEGPEEKHGHVGKAVFGFIIRVLGPQILFDPAEHDFLGRN